MDALDVAKRDKMKDILRRLVANPAKMDEVTNELSLDWFPMMQIEPSGNITFILGTGHKK